MRIISTGVRSMEINSIEEPLILLCSFCFSIAAKQAQIVEYTEKSQEKQESRHVQLVREYGFHPRSKVQVQDGSLLPRKFEPFPADMYGRPLEEIDQFIYEEVSTRHACFPHSSHAHFLFISFY